MGLLFANPAPPRQSERQTGFAPCQRFKSPKAASNLQFERPWDRLVPAKSARKLTAPMVVSKKFWLATRSYRVRCPQRMEPRRGEPKSAEDSGHYSAHVSADSAASLFRFSSCEYAHDYS